MKRSGSSVGGRRPPGRSKVSSALSERSMTRWSSRPESEEIIVQSGDACLDLHLLGSGPIVPDQSVLIDCFPRDRRTGVYSDMTRTFATGTPSEDLRSIHKHVRTALEMAFESIKPGGKGPHEQISEYFHSQGF